MRYKDMQCIHHPYHFPLMAEMARNDKLSRMLLTEGQERAKLLKELAEVQRRIRALRLAPWWTRLKWVFTGVKP